MPDDVPRARRPIRCPECGIRMTPGWVETTFRLESGGSELRWTGEDLEPGTGRAHLGASREVLPERSTRWGCWCEGCETLYLRTTVAPDDEPDAEYAWTATPCLRCGETILPPAERCGSCGWTWGLDADAVADA